MSAQIVILAQYRERKARLEYSVTYDPLVFWWAWIGFWSSAR